jgi:hypothetical protein
LKLGTYLSQMSVYITSFYIGMNTYVIILWRVQTIARPCMRSACDHSMGVIFVHNDIHVLYMNHSMVYLTS